MKTDPMTIWIFGSPYPFATSGEAAWKQALSAAIPEGPVGQQTEGVEVTFQHRTFLRRNQPFDLDNLCEPVLSVLVNTKKWFGGGRPNIQWIRARKIFDPNEGCLLTLSAVDPTPIEGDLVLEHLHLGPLPKGARDPALYQALSGFPTVSPTQCFGVSLKFVNHAVNLGEIATAPVKSLIDSLFPVIGGTVGRPHDWRITELLVSKQSKPSEEPTVEVKVRRVGSF